MLPISNSSAGAKGAEKLIVGSGLIGSIEGRIWSGSHSATVSVDEVELCEAWEVQLSQPVLVSLSPQLPLS